MKTLVAGIGNIFCSDDGFGTAVVRRLEREEMPPDAKLVDFGIGEIHLAFELLEGYERLVLVDALAAEEPPGTIVVLRPDAPGGSERAARVLPDPHDLAPVAVLELLDRLGQRPADTLVVGCVPASTAAGIGLSAPVSDAIEAAADLVRGLVGEEAAAASAEGDDR